MKEENPPYFFDRVGIGLRRMAGANDKLGLDALDMGTPVFDDAVIPGLDRTVTADGDDRVGLDPFGNGGACQRLYQQAAGRHRVDAGEPCLCSQDGRSDVQPADFRGRLKDVHR